MGKSQREKGKRGERELSKALTEHLGFECRRGQQYSGIEGSDVVGIPGVHIESKRTEKLRLYEAIDQARTDAGDSVPAVFHRRNSQEWLAVIPLSELRRFCECVLRGET